MNYPPVGGPPQAPVVGHPPVGAFGVPQYPPRHPLPPQIPPQVQQQVKRNVEPKDSSQNLLKQQKNDQKSPNENDLVELENDVFTAHWMSGFYEPHASNHMSSSILYQDYISTCAALKRENVLPKEEFFAAIR